MTPTHHHHHSSFTDYEITWQFDLVDIRRARSRHRLFLRKCGISHHNHRHSCRTADREARTAVSVAIRRRNSGYRQAKRVHQYSAQHIMANIRRLMGLSYSLTLWRTAMHHHHRHSIRQTALQTGCPIISAIR